MDIKKLAVKVLFKEPYSDYEEEVYLPLEENLDAENLSWENFGDDESTIEECVELAFLALKEKWEKIKWGFQKDAIEVVDYAPLVGSEKTRDRRIAALELEYKHKCSQLSLFPELTPIEPLVIPDMPIIKNYTDTTKCAEFGIWCYTSQMEVPEMWSRPFDSFPEDCKYSCDYAVRCNKGEIYSKDFAYFECGECQRSICQQNPSNGWMVQYRFLDDDDGEMVCLKCFEEHLFLEGIDVEDAIRTKTIKGMDLNTSELLDKGFTIFNNMEDVLVGSGYTGSQSPDVFFSRLSEKIDELKNKITIFGYGSMAIGGLGGYITVWVKDKEQCTEE
jgi:hypothetical protein